jgi:hypothetical protein
MGRTSLLLVIGFNVVFMVTGFRISTQTTQTYEKYLGYCDIEQAQLAAESAANIGISDAFFNPAGAIPGGVIGFPSSQEGTFTIIKDIRFSAAGTIDSIIVNVNGNYNMAGGGFLASNQVQLNTSVVISGGSFSQFVMFTESEKMGSPPEAIWWRTGDICRGAFHTQDYVNVNGSPIFEGKVTTKMGIKYNDKKKDKPDFQQGYTSGVDISITKTDFGELTALGKSGGAYSYYNGVATYVEFKADGSVIVRTGSNGWSEKKTTQNTSVTPPVPYCKTYPSVAALTSSTVLLVNNAELHVKGVLDGKITLGAIGSSSKVWIDSSVVYKSPPPCSQAPGNVSDDLLGIITEKDIMVTNNSNNKNGVELDASIFSRSGGFGADQYDSRGNCGVLKIVGGIQEYYRRAVGLVTTPPVGFLKDYNFDFNLQREAPAGYPRTAPVIQNWVDNTTIPRSFWDGRDSTSQ